VTTKKLPKINEMKFGVIDAPFVNTATTLANEFADMMPKLNQLLKFSEEGFAKLPILVKITESTAIVTVDIEFAVPPIREVDVAWEYKWERVSIESESTIIPDVGVGHTVNEEWNSDVVAEMYGSRSGIAYNVAEMANRELAPIVFGVDMSSSSYPSGFLPMPTTAGEYMFLRSYRTDDGYFFYFFDRTGIHDGACSVMVEPTP
jgi:hypothetical protein